MNLVGERPATDIRRGEAVLLPKRLRRGGLFLQALLAGVCFLSTTPALAGDTPVPTGGTYVAGQGSITGSANGVTVNQTSAQGVINWQNFSVGSGNTVQFNNGNGATLNRVVGTDLSRIDGQISATGSVYLVNPQGIVVGPGGKVVTNGSFVASTRDVSDHAFMAGGAFNASGSSNGAVVNAGAITSSNGDAILVGRSVTNSGTVSAPNGSAIMAAGNQILLRPAGSDSRIAVSGGTGDATNTGTVTAAQAQLSAAGGNVYALAGNNGGLIAATGSKTVNGQVWLTAGGATEVSGTVSAVNANGTGGTVTINGGSVALKAATVSASGSTGGGTIAIGDWSVTAATVDSASSLRASATQSGNGGSITVLSHATEFNGRAEAKGGAASGNGGFIETSGHLLNIDEAAIDTSAANGHVGQWLLDPRNVTISTGTTSRGTFASNAFTPSGDSSVLNATTLLNALANSDVTVTTGASGTQHGDITVSAALSWTSTRTLKLMAAGDIAINNAITASNGGLYLSAGTFDVANFTGAPGNITATGAVGVKTFTLAQGNWLQNSANLPSFSATNFSVDADTWAYGTYSGSFVRVKGGDGSAGNPYQIADVYGLMGIGFSTTTLNQNYKLVNDINASGLSDFASIGNDSVPDNFTGTLDGQNYTISNLTSTGTANGMAGLFGWAFSGTLKNTTIVSGNFGGTNAIAAGVVAQNTGGTISNVTVRTSTAKAYQSAGGLVGQMSSGSISNSQSDVAVSTVGNFSMVSPSFAAGGLIGSMVGGTVTQSYATGSVAGGRSAGGFVGNMSGGTISQSYATGTVTLTPTSASLGTSWSAGSGGFAGVVQSGATINQSFALGSVALGGTNSASIPLGSFVGANGGTINEAFGAGAVVVTSGTGTTGGFAGATSALKSGVSNAGTLTNTYYDNQTTGQNAQAGGLSTSQLQGTLPGGFNTLSSAWATGPGMYPYLSAFGTAQKVSGTAYKDSGAVPAASSNLGTVAVSLTVNSSSAGTVSTGANGYYYFLLQPGAINTSSGTPVSAALVADPGLGISAYDNHTTATGNLSGFDLKLIPTISGTAYSDYGGTALSGAHVIEAWLGGGAVIASTTTNGGGSYSVNGPAASGTLLLFLDNSNGTYATTVVSYGGSSLSGVNLYGNNLHFSNTSATSVTTLLQSLAGFAQPTGNYSSSDFLFNVSNGTVTPSAGLVITSTGSITLDQSLTFTGSNGLAIKNSAGDITIANSLGIASGKLVLDSYQGTNVDANVTVSGGGAVTLTTNDGGSGGDYIFRGDASLQFTGAANSGATLTINGSPYTLLYTASSILSTVNTSGGVSGKYALAKPVDAAATTWKPIGTNGAGVLIGTGFSGTFEGLGNTISNVTVNQGLISGSVSGQYVGVFGYNAGTIRDLGVLNVNITGGFYTGGLVGFNTSSGTISRSYSTGTVKGVIDTGGLVGASLGTLSGVYSTATITAVDSTDNSSVTHTPFRAQFAGGLAGATGGTITNVYATGNVTATSGGIATGIGGLLGANSGALSNAYSSGTVSAPAGATRTNASIGRVNAGSTATNVYYNSDTAGLTDSATGVTGLSTADLKAGPAGLNASPWVVASGSYPQLNFRTLLQVPTISGTVYSDYGGSALGGATVIEAWLGGGAVIGSTTSASGTGAYSINGPATSGNVLLFLDNSNGTYATTVVPWSSTSLTGVDLYGSYLNVVNTPATTVSAVLQSLSGFAQPTGGYSSNDFLINVSSGTVTPKAGLAISSTGSITLDQSMTFTGSNGLALKSGSGDITISNPVSLVNGNLTLDSYQGIGVDANLTVSGGGKVVLTTNDGGSGGDYIFRGGTSLQFTGASNSGAALTINGSPYTLLYSMSDVQGMSLSGKSALAKPLDATATTSWTPIAPRNSIDPTNPDTGTYLGTFEGLGNTISNLNFSYGGVTFIGFFSAIGSTGLVRDFGLSGGSVTATSGTGTTGGIVGILRGGTLLNDWASSTVKGITYGGGLAGRLGSGGTISNSYASGSVSGSAYAGGLVGNAASSTISNSYSSATVMGGNNAGGLIGGSSSMTITNVFATGAVTGPSSVGGLVGSGTATITNGYWDTTTTGQATSAGGSGLTTAALQAGPTGLNATPWVTVAGHYPVLNWQVRPAGGGSPTSITYSVANASGTYGTLATLGAITFTGIAIGDAGNVTGVLSLYDTGNNLVSLASTLSAGTYTEKVTSLTGSAAGSYTIAATGNTFGTLTIAPLPIVVTGTRVYDGTTDAASSLFSITNAVGSDVVGLSGTGTLAGANVGSQTLTSTGGALTGFSVTNTNYTLTGASGSVTVTARPITVTADGKTRIYGDTNPSLTYQITTGSLTGSDAFSGALTTVATSSSGVGGYAIGQGSLALSSNYDLSFVSGTLSITARPITVTADNKSRIYNTANPSLTYQITTGSLVGSDALSGSLATTAVLGSDVGDYAITQGTLTSAANPNYAIQFIPGMLTVNPATLTLHYSIADTNSTYGTLATLGTLTLTGVAEADQGNVNGVVSLFDSKGGATTLSSLLSVGTYTEKVTGLTGTAAGNYILATSGNRDGTLTVAARPITVTADGKTRIYGDANPLLTYQITAGSLVGDDAFSGALTTVATSSSGVGGYDIGQGTLALSSNYALSFVPGTLTVTARPITVTADGKTRTYGDTNPALTYQITTGSLVGGDAFTGALTTSATTTSGVGGYTIGQGSLALSSNYALSFVLGTLTVTARPITVTADGKTRIYGDTNPALTYQITTGNLVGSDAFTGALTTVATSSSGVGGYAIGQGTLALSSNYALSFVPGTLTVTARPITVTADGKTRTYGDTNPALTYQITTGSLVGNDAFTGALSTAATSSSGVGGYDIGQGTLVLSSNYALSFVPGTLTVTARPITVTADGKTRIYGDINPALTYQITTGSLVGSDAFSGALTTVATSSSGVGGYAIGQGSLALSSNYALSFVPGTLTVTARLITVTADGKTRIYGDANPLLTYQITTGSLVGDDAFSGALSTAATTSSGVGGYTIGQGSLALSSNYALSFVPGTLTVTARPITVTADGKTRTYGDANPALTYQITTGNLVGNDAFSGALTTAATSSSGVGGYGIGQGTLALSSNYALSFVPGTLTVTARPITVTADGKTRIYGDVNPSLTYQITTGNLVGDDAFSGALTTAATSSSGVGGYTIGQGSLALSSNYALSFVPGTLTVTARPITVTADGKTRIYGDTNPALTYQITTGNLVGSDAFSGALTTSATTTSGVGGYTIGQGSLALNANYSLSFIPGTLTVTPALLNITANDVVAISLADAGFTARYLGFVNGENSLIVTRLQFGLFPQGANGLRFDIVPFGASAPNYTIAYFPGLLTIKQPQAPLVDHGVYSNFVVTSSAGTATFSKVVTEAVGDSGKVLLFQAGLPGQVSSFYQIAITDFSNVLSTSDRLAGGL